jgi:hypothetical protein
MTSRILWWVPGAGPLARLARLSLIVSLMCGLFATSAKAAPFVYVVTLSQQFGTIDLANGKFQPIGSGTPDGLSNLVRWRGSLRTLTTFPTLGSLARINPATGEETIIGETGLSFNAFDLGQSARKAVPDRFQ